MSHQNYPPEFIEEVIHEATVSPLLTARLDQAIQGIASDTGRAVAASTPDAQMQLRTLLPQLDVLLRGVIYEGERTKVSTEPAAPLAYLSEAAPIDQRSYAIGAATALLSVLNGAVTRQDIQLQQ